MGTVERGGGIESEGRGRGVEREGGRERGEVEREGGRERGE